MPEHGCYAECFAGGLWVLFKKQPSKDEIVNDVNSELINLYRTIQRNCDKFKERAKYELYARELYYEYLQDFYSGKHHTLDNVERAFRFFYLIKAAFASKFGAGFAFGSNRQSPVSFFNEFKILDDITKRLKNVTIDNRDFEDIIRSYDSERTLYFCCLPGTKVRMKDEELRNIEDVKIGEEVFYGNKVLNTMSRDYSGVLYELEVMGIYDSLNVTEEHPLAIIKKEDAYEFIKYKGSKIHSTKFKSEHELNHTSIYFVKAKDVKEGDFVIIPCYAENISDVRYVDIGNTKILCDEYFGWICGFWLAEGSFVKYYKNYMLTPSDINSLKNKKQATLFDNSIDFRDLENKCVHDSLYAVQYSMGEDDLFRNYSDNLKHWYKVHFGTEGFTYQVHEKSYQMIIFRDEIAKYFFKTFGQYAENKSVSKELMNYPLNFQKGLLRGWLDGDGGIWKGDRNRTKITGTTISKKLALCMYSIALRLGLRPALKFRAGRIWDVYFGSDDARVLYPELEIKERSKRKVIINSKGKFVISPITKILKRNYNGIVHNLTTENNLYVANYIITHNCDPPYMKSDNTDYYFKSANSSFGLHDHQRLFVALKSIEGKFILTVDDTPWVRERYCSGKEIILGEVVIGGISHKVHHSKETGFYWLDNEVYYCSADADNRRHEVELIIVNYNPNEIRKHTDINQGKLEF